MEGKKIKELTQEQLSECKSHIYYTKNQLFTLYNGATERLIKFLLLLNTGGLIACLSYFHPNKPNGLIIPIMLFTAGILASLATVAIDYFGCSKRAKDFNKDTKLFYKNTIKFGQISVFLKENKYKCAQTCMLVTGFIATALAIAGIGFGLSGIL